MNITNINISLAGKFYITLVLPLVCLAILVTIFTNSGLNDNAAELTTALQFQSEAKEILPLLLIQDDASKAILMDPEQFDLFSDKKIEAYDSHKIILEKIRNNSTNQNMINIIDEVFSIDEEFLRPIDTEILETMFEDIDKARNIYFEKYQPKREIYENLIRKLGELGTINAEIAHSSMKKNNLKSLLQILFALIIGIVVVLVVIVVLTRQIELTNSNMENLLGSLHEGLFFFNSDGTIALEKSQALKEILPDSEKCKDIFQFFSKYSDCSDKKINTVLSLLWQDQDDGFYSDINSTFSMLPNKIYRDSENERKHIVLEYKPIYGKNDILKNIVVIVEDVTQQEKNEIQARIQAERVNKIAKAAANFNIFIDFSKESNQLFERVNVEFKKNPKEINIDQLKRDLHTIKGSIAIFEFNSLSSEVHKFEDYISQFDLSEKNKTIHEFWARIDKRWAFELDDIKKSLGIENDYDSIEINKGKIVDLTNYVNNTDDTELKDKVEALQRVNIKNIFSGYESYISKIESSSDNKRVKLAYKKSSDEASFTEIQKMDGAIVHLLRNCFDHGIETIEERQKIGKPKEGIITVGFARSNPSGIEMTIEDDGAGIDLEKLTKKAIENNIWTIEKAKESSETDKINLIFLPNFSSKDEVTSISGRGVGMDAVKNMIKELGGNIQVETKINTGSKFIISFNKNIHDLIPSNSNSITNRQYRVMVIDDDDLIIELMSFLINSYGYKMFDFQNPVDAIQQFEIIQPDVIITDFKMPKVDGIELLNTIRDQKKSQCPIILCTGYECSKLLDSNKNKFDLVSKKPIDFDNLVFCISKLVKDKNKLIAS